MHIFGTYTCTLWKRATPSSDARVQHTWTRPMQPMRALLLACTPSPALPSLCCRDLDLFADRVCTRTRAFALPARIQHTWARLTQHVRARPLLAHARSYNALHSSRCTNTAHLLSVCAPACTGPAHPADFKRKLREPPSKHA